MAEIGETCRKHYLFTAENIGSVANALGDVNPAHHDPAMAAATRFGGIIAAAGHSAGVFVSLLAEHFTRRDQAYGLEFSYKLKRAVPAGLDAIMEWRVTGKKHSEKLGGDLLSVEGRLFDGEGRTYIEGKGLLLIVPAVPAPG